MPSGKSRQTGSGSSRRKPQKRKVRSKFMERHIDQVFGDFVSKPEDVHDGKYGPRGSDSRCAAAAAWQAWRPARPDLLDNMDAPVPLVGQSSLRSASACADV